MSVEPLYPKTTLDRETEKTLEFTHDGSRLTHTRCPDSEGFLSVFQLRQCTNWQVALNPQHSRQGWKGGITQPHVFHGVKFCRGISHQGLENDSRGEVDNSEPISRLFCVDPVGCYQASRTRHVLHNEPGLARYVKREMPGQKTCEGIETASWAEADDDPNCLAFEERGGRPMYCCAGVKPNAQEHCQSE